MSKYEKTLNYITDVIDDLRHTADSVQSEASDMYDELDRLMSQVDELDDELASEKYTARLTDETVDQIIFNIRDREGFTLNINNCNEFIYADPLKRNNYLAVARGGEYIVVSRGTSKNDKMISAIIQAYADGMIDGGKLGGWYDKDSGNYMLETVDLYSDIITAYREMVSGGQMALYDFTIGEDIGLSTLYTLDQLSGGDDDKLRQLYDEYTDMIKNKKALNDRGAE